MKSTLIKLLSLCLLLNLAALTQADDREQALKIVNKGIRAAGGLAKLKKYRAETWKEKGTYFGMGEGLPYEGIYAIQLPQQFKMEILGVFAIVVNKDKGWMKSQGETKAMDADQLKEQQEGLYQSRVITLAPLSDKAFQLSLLGEQAIGNKPAVGVKVSQKGHRDVSLFFDKKTGLLIRSQAIVKSPEHGNKEVMQEINFERYTEISGMKVCNKSSMKRAGKIFLKMEMSDIKLAENLDDKLFAKP